MIKVYKNEELLEKDSLAMQSSGYVVKDIKLDKVESYHMEWSGSPLIRHAVSYEKPVWTVVWERSND